MTDETKKSFTPFDFAKSISETKIDLMVDSRAEKAYSPFVVHHLLSSDPECLIMVQELNIRPTISKRMGYSFLLNIVSKKKRYFTYHKSIAKSENLEVIQEYYQCNSQKAMEILSILDDEQISIIKRKMTRGGKNEQCGTIRRL